MSSGKQLDSKAGAVALWINLMVYEDMEDVMFLMVAGFEHPPINVAKPISIYF